MEKPQDDVALVWTSDEGSMAKDTAANRWPRIITDVLQDLDEAKNKTENEAARTEVELIAVGVERMLHEIRDDLPLRELPQDDDPHIDQYNAVINSNSFTWRNGPWLFVECYMYRMLHTFFARSEHWKHYDVFQGSKNSTFTKSNAAVEELCGRYLDMKTTIGALQDDQAKKVLFLEMTEVALWGNATDLSLLSNLSLEEIQNLQGQEAIKKSQKNIVDNDIDQAWTHLQKSPQGPIDIVLDNAGYELLTDVVYALYLLDSGIASLVRLHVKDFGWFVSDALVSDISCLFKILSSFQNQKQIGPFLKHLRSVFDSGKIQIVQNNFWTHFKPFNGILQNKGLMKYFKQSKLVVFKGDLNYRKLVFDAHWPVVTPFKQALGELGQASGIKILALRTNKSDSCVGIESREKADQLDQEAPGRAWIKNGKYAVISFYDGN